MRPDLHPAYQTAKVHCACGNTWETRSTGGELHLDVCSACHPFFTGKQKLMDTAGRIDRFNKKYAATTAKKAELAAKAATKEAAKQAEAKASKPEPKAEAKAPEAKAEPKGGKEKGKGGGNKAAKPTAKA